VFDKVLLGFHMSENGSCYLMLLKVTCLWIVE